MSTFKATDLPILLKQHVDYFDTTQNHLFGEGKFLNFSLRPELLNSQIPISAIYPAYDGEVNGLGGIGEPTIFLRVQGCHLRCYKSTMGVLCDTPEALGIPAKSETRYFRTVSDVAIELLKFTEEASINKITWSGGDPLFMYKQYKDEFDMLFLIVAIAREQINSMPLRITVETSGTVDQAVNFAFNGVDIKAKAGGYSTFVTLPVTYILDFKLPSAGVKAPFIVPRYYPENVEYHRIQNHVVIKFVVVSEEEAALALKEARRIRSTKKELGIDGKLSMYVGVYWGKEYTTQELFNYMTANGGWQTFNGINAQVHKLCHFAEGKNKGYTDFPTEI